MTRVFDFPQDYVNHDSSQSNSISGVIGGSVVMTKFHVAVQIPMATCMCMQPGRAGTGQTWWSLSTNKKRLHRSCLYTKPCVLFAALGAEIFTCPISHLSTCRPERGTRVTAAKSSRDEPWRVLLFRRFTTCPRHEDGRVSETGIFRIFSH